MQTNSTEIPDISLNATNFIPNKQHLVLKKASLREIADVFDEYIYDAIRRIRF